MQYKDIQLNSDDKSILLNTDRDAKKYARQAHDGQMYGDSVPYLYHLEQVYILAQSCVKETWMGSDLRLLEQLSYLHDVLEDTSTTEEQLIQKFGVFVLAGVKLLTDETGKNRKERKARMNARLGALAVTSDGINRLVLIVKVSDRLANVMNCIRTQNHGLWKMYAKEHQAFKAAAYRQDLCEHLWTRLDILMDASSEALFDSYVSTWILKEDTAVSTKAKVMPKEVF